MTQNGCLASWRYEQQIERESAAFPRRLGIDLHLVATRGEGLIPKLESSSPGERMLHFRMRNHSNPFSFVRLFRNYTPPHLHHPVLDVLAVRVHRLFEWHLMKQTRRGKKIRRAGKWQERTEDTEKHFGAIGPPCRICIVQLTPPPPAISALAYCFLPIARRR